MRRKLIHWLGLTGVPALLSYTAAVVLLTIASLVCLIVAGCREKAVRKE